MIERPGRLTITVDVGRADPELLDDLMLGLCDELRMLDVASVHRPASGPVPFGARGVAAMSITDLIVSGVFSAGTLGAVVRVLTQWIQRCGARRVVLEEGGDRLELDGLARSEQRELINAWIRRRTAPGAPEQADAQKED